MSVAKCNFELVVTEAEKSAALSFGRCEVCSRSELDLRKIGQTLEVCGVEHYTDFGSGKATMLAIPLCPACHEEIHLNAHMSNEPCPFRARQSWETLA